jgi:hypothetical protein
MARRSKRELERALEELSTEDDDHLEITLHETVVGTEWEGSDLDPGDVVEETTVFEI